LIFVHIFVIPAAKLVCARARW